MSRLTRCLLIVLVPSGLLLVLVYALTWRPAALEQMPVSCNATPGAQVLVPGQALKVMTWNIQYLAGKRYVFWYDMADGSGPDAGPTPEDVAYNLDEVARVIRDEQPDVLLLQEVNDGAKNTAYDNQLALLRARVIDLYPCSTEAFYRKADFIPNPHIAGSVGMKLATLSRFSIERAERIQLPLQEANLIRRQFQPKPALLVTYLTLRDGGHLALINTHLDNPDPESGDDVSLRQVQAIRALLDGFEASATPWLIGGDFNLLPSDQYQRLSREQQGAYPPDSPLHLLWDTYPMIPSNDEASGVDRGKWLTRFPNDPRISGPDRTVDYLFHSPGLKRVSASVRGEDTLLISDHLPLIARFLLPLAP